MNIATPIVTVDVNAAIDRVGGSLPDGTRKFVGLLVLSADPAALARLLSEMDGRTLSQVRLIFAALAAADARLAALPDWFADAVVTVARASENAAKSRGLAGLGFNPASMLAAFGSATGGAGGVAAAGNVFGDLIGGISSVVGSVVPFIGPIGSLVGTVAGLVNGNQPNLPAYDWNTANAQQAAAAAARSWWASGANAVPPANPAPAVAPGGSPGSTIGGINTNTLLIVGAGLLAVYLISRRK